MQHFNKILINRKHLQHNIKYIKTNFPEYKLGVVLKSNAYGHGLTTVAPLFDQETPDYLIVFDFAELEELLKLDLKTPLMQIGYISPGQLTYLQKHYNLNTREIHICVWNLKHLKSLKSLIKNIKIHIFVDTGMHREGLSMKKLPTLLKYMKQNNINLTGVCSHLSDADNTEDQSYTKYQYKNFMSVQNIIKKFNYNPTLVHINASAGMLLAPQFTQSNLVRLGGLSYGIPPIPNNLLEKSFKPILSLQSKIVQIKKLEPSTFIGYNKTVKTTKPTKIALLPIGYNDGVPRELSNTGFVKLKSRLAPIIGRISMNITTVDITHIKSVKPGMSATIIEDSNSSEISVINIAQKINKIPDQILVGINSKLKRVLK